MIEIICKDDPVKAMKGQKEEAVYLPKNIRQVGSPKGRHKVYLEDYVYTYLRSAAKNNESCAAVFLGKSQVVKEIRYTFISGVVECSAAVFQWEHICLDESFWDYIHKEQKQYFPELEIAGWFLGKAGQALELAPAVEAAHRKYFAGRDKILMLMDILEEEELFYVYEQGYLQKREGYYIYYEKNLFMQEYMICKREEEKRLQELRRQASQTDEEELEIDDAKRKMSREDLQADKESRLDDAKDKLEEEKETENDFEDIPLLRKEGEETSIILEGETAEDAALTDRKKQEGTFRESESDLRAMLKEMHHQEKKLGKKLRDGVVLQKPGSQEKIFARSNLEEPKTQAEEALEAYRKTMLERRGRQEERQNRRFLYTASSFFLVVLCVIGITTINNYRKMLEVENVLNLMNRSGVGAQQQASGKDDELVVETVESQVEPLEEKKKERQSENQGQPKEGQSQSDETQKQPQENQNRPKEGQNQEQSKEGQAQTAAGASQPKEEQSQEQSKEGQAQTAAGASQPKEEQSQSGQSQEQSKEEKSQTAASASQPKESQSQSGQSREQPKEGQAQTQQASAVVTEGEKRYYTVQPGDTLNSICLGIYQSKDMVQALMDANGIEDGDRILAGQRLLLPEK